MEAIRPEPTPLLSLLFSVAIITINFSPSKSCLLSLIICSSFPYTVACAKLDSLYHLLVVCFCFQQFVVEFMYLIIHLWKQKY